MTLEEIAKLLDAATPVRGLSKWYLTPEQARFYAASRTLLPKLLAFVRAYDAYVKAHEGNPPLVMRMGNASFEPQQALIAARAALESPR